MSTGVRAVALGAPMTDAEVAALLDTLAVWHLAHDPLRFPCRCGTFHSAWGDQPCALDAIPLALLRGVDVGWRP